LWKLLGENKLYKAQEAMATRVVATATVRAVKGRKLIFISVLLIKNQFK